MKKTTIVRLEFIVPTYQVFMFLLKVFYHFEIQITNTLINSYIERQFAFCIILPPKVVHSNPCNCLYLCLRDIPLHNSKRPHKLFPSYTPYSAHIHDVSNSALLWKLLMSYVFIELIDIWVYHIGSHCIPKMWYGMLKFANHLMIDTHTPCIFSLT